MNQWINGISLKQIIGEGIEYYHREKREILLGWGNSNAIKERFNNNNSLHINTLANNIIDDIEHKLRFLFEKYFDHYYRNIANILGEENSGPNWALYLEYGTKNTIVIALQNLGLSRHSASLIYKKHSNCLKIIDGKLQSIDRAELMTRFDKNSLEYDELKTFL